MKSKDLASEIEKLISEYKDKSSGASAKLQKEKIIQLIKGLYYNSIEDNYIFFDSPLSLYKENFKNILVEFQKVNLDADDVDFMKSEVKKLFYPEDNRIINLVNYHEFTKGLESFEITRKKKKEYLLDELIKKGVSLENSPIENASPYEEIPLDTEVRFNDFRDRNAMLNNNRVILLLEEFGFFSHDNLVDVSQIKIASLLRKITGYNEKNTLNYLKKLNKKPGELGDNYQRDKTAIKTILYELKTT